MKIAIIEDDCADGELLESLLRQHFLRENTKAEISLFSSGDDFLAEWPQELDILFLDIQMPGKNGIQIAEKVRETDERVLIIFVTNSAQYSLAGYSVEALDYLLKPATPELLDRLLTRAVRRLGSSERSYLTIHNSDGLFVVNLSDVNFIELQNRRLIVHTSSEQISCMGTLQSMEEQLPSTFFRCHTAFIINLNAVERLKGPDVIVAGAVIPISKHRRKDFIRALTDCIGETL